MKMFKLVATTAAVALLSSTAFADAVVIKGVSSPTFTDVTIDNGVYVPATTVTPVSDYYFLNVDKTEKVCRTEAVPGIGAEITPISVRIGGTSQKMYCYNRTYFTFE